MNYLLDRSNLHGQPLGPEADRLFNRSIRCEFRILLSDWVAKELYNKLDPAQTRMLFEFLKKKIIKVESDEEDIKKAKRLNPNHYEDALHAILANKNNADYLITRNIKDFIEYKNLVEPKFPKDI